MHYFLITIQKNQPVCTTTTNHMLIFIMEIIEAPPIDAVIVSDFKHTQQAFNMFVAQRKCHSFISAIKGCRSNFPNSLLATVDALLWKLGFKKQQLSEYFDICL